MKLHRLALVELRPAPSRLRRWTISTTRGLDVSINNFTGAEDATTRPELSVPQGPTISWGRSVEQAPARVLLTATQEVHLDTNEDVSLRVPMGASKESERALSEAANLLAISCQAQHDVFSPRPYAFLEADSETEHATLSKAQRISLPPLRSGGSVQGPGGDRNTIFAGLLADREHGVALLGAALGAGHGVAKLHELIRVFESGFAVSGQHLVKLVTEFLRSYPNWEPGYTKGEVKSWIAELRDPATHADLRKAKGILLDTDVESALPRIEQAAYDVLFNKAIWHVRDASRLQRWSFAAMIKPDGSSIVSDGAVLRVHDEWDHQHAFRLNEKYRIGADSVPTSWIPVDWYFPDNVAK